MQLSLRLLIAALITWLLLSSSGCTTAAVQPNLQKPVTCLLPVADALALLPPGFAALSPEAKARALLTLHDHDGQAYAIAVTELRDCQAFVARLP